MSKLRVLVIEDSQTIRKRIVEILASDPDVEVVGEAADGRSGAEMCQALRPNVVTLDMMLPVMNGLEATEFIMAHCPTPILVVSASTNRGDLFKTYEALAAGALDVLDKPLGDETEGAWERRLLSTIKLLSRIKVITHPRGRLRTLDRNVDVPGTTKAIPDPGLRAVAIGVSTGGPNALVQILGALSPQFPLPIIVVIHIAEMFASAFAEWLEQHSALPVAFARNGEPLPAVGKGRVIIAVPDRHLVLREGRLHLTNDSERHSCRPSVDVLFESLARELGNRCIACLLTGMGRDGASGLLDIRRAGGHTIAQDEGSSVVFGMPKEAIEIGAAERVLPLGTIASVLTELSGRTNVERSP